MLMQIAETLREWVRERAGCLQCNRYRKHDEVAMHMDVCMCLCLIVPLKHIECVKNPNGNG